MPIRVRRIRQNMNQVIILSAFAVCHGRAPKSRLSLSLKVSSTIFPFGLGNVPATSNHINGSAFSFIVFSDVNIKNGHSGIHFTETNGRPSGEAYIELNAEEDIQKAKAHSKEFIGTR